MCKECREKLDAIASRVAEWEDTLKDAEGRIITLRVRFAKRSISMDAVLCELEKVQNMLKVDR